MSLAIVTATTDWDRAQPCVDSWLRTCRHTAPTLYVVGQKLLPAGPREMPRWVDIDAGITQVKMKGYRVGEILGVVPAFAIGVQQALQDGHDVIACLHDDVEITDPGWNRWVELLFKDNPQIGLVGFGGGIGLGDEDIYQVPYNPMQLARKAFVSNMRDATAHGARSIQPIQVACLDGFSQIGRAAYWAGILCADQEGYHYKDAPGYGNLFADMAKWGIVHHAYDAALGCFAKRLGYQVWMLPIGCHHYGGRTAVGDPNYQAWARLQKTGTTEGDCGDAGFWKQAHQIVYDQFRDVLPIRITSPTPDMT